MFFFLKNRYIRAVDKMENSFVTLTVNDVKLKSTAKTAIVNLNNHCDSTFKWFKSFFTGDGLILRIAANKAVTALTVEAQKIHKIHRESDVKIKDFKQENQNLIAINEDLNKQVEVLENALSDKNNEINKLKESIAKYEGLNGWLSAKNKQLEEPPNAGQYTKFFSGKKPAISQSLDTVREEVSIKLNSN